MGSRGGASGGLGATGQTSTFAMDGKVARLYDLEETLGKGHYAVVKLARHVFTGERVAVKVIDKTRLDDASKAQLYQEIRCMKMVQHPIVVRLYEVIDTQTKLYLVLEYGDGGDLYDYIMRHEHGVDEATARRHFRQIIRAISYCHQLHVVHRDLKPENVVFFKRLGLVKLTDFGFSNKFSPGQKLATSCGSLAYSAPEILLGDQYDAPAVDIWSLGVILYMLVCGRPPFQEATDNETLIMIMDCKYTVPAHVSKECKKLIGRMLQREPGNRASLESIANDQWLMCGPGEGDCAKYEDYLPLVSRHHLSEEEHGAIVNEMVTGGVADEEQIHCCLEKDEYNHVTATYFLLAEKRLRGRRLQQTAKCHSAPEEATHLAPPHPSHPHARDEDQDVVCSLVKTKSAENILSDEESQRPRKRDPSSLDDFHALQSALKEESLSSTSSSGSNSLSSSPTKKPGTSSSGVRKLHPVKSSPQLVLNEICEEDESDASGVEHGSLRLLPATIVSPSSSCAVGKGILSSGSQTGMNSKNIAVASSSSSCGLQTRCRIAKRHFVRKLPSCSSSDASDEEEAKKNQKQQQMLLWKRRDSSHDDSSAEEQQQMPVRPPADVVTTTTTSKKIVSADGLQRRHSSNEIWRSRPAGRRISLMRQSQSLSRIGELQVLILDPRAKRATSADGMRLLRATTPPTSSSSSPVENRDDGAGGTTTISVKKRGKIKSFMDKRRVGAATSGTAAAAVARHQHGKCPGPSGGGGTTSTGAGKACNMSRVLVNIAGMFKNTFQSGFLSILYSIGSKPLQIWDKKVRNGHIKRITDNDIQSLVLEIIGTNVSTTFITCPADPRKTLGIKLPFLVMIVKNLKKYFTFEVQILDDKNVRRRFRASNYQSTTRVKPFICTIPMRMDEGWNQIQFNLADFTKRAYGTNYVETLRVQIHANCRIRRVYFSDRLYSEDELPAEFKLYLPVSNRMKN
ncbi:unnamed protein product [Notodromas monacha]|uniref:SNF-related serine/threonine-protein kinase n=1 Tax=Notodromas monacha TaxID=399045 RepID=A0A7R9BIG9_9CRUS|nr:unnamed protein product [Notodromas monacha]CAG0914719.1 unnamed protein product [Notodromas monacha]